MSKIDRLISHYEEVIALPWERDLAGPQKVWFLVYDENEERRVRARHEEFKLATQRAGRKWILCDITNSFPAWMASQEYREEFFHTPEDLELTLEEFLDYTADEIKARLEDADDTTVVAVLGVGTLFGLIRLSDLVDRVHPAIQGRMAVFFPGEYHGNTYRLLDARAGWDYLALPITA